MSIRYFEVYLESDKDDETERYLCTNRSDAISLANRDWWSMPEYKRNALDYFCVEAYEVDDDFGECISETVVRTWKPTEGENFADLNSKATLRALINIANGYEDNEFAMFEKEAESENFCDSASDEVKAVINAAWEKSRAGE